MPRPLYTEPIGSEHRRSGRGAEDRISSTGTSWSRPCLARSGRTPTASS